LTRPKEAGPLTALNPAQLPPFGEPELRDEEQVVVTKTSSIIPIIIRISIIIIIIIIVIIIIIFTFIFIFTFIYFFFNLPTLFFCPSLNQQSSTPPGQPFPSLLPNPHLKPQRPVECFDRSMRRHKKNYRSA
jgi:hypothetical protein